MTTIEQLRKETLDFLEENEVASISVTDFIAREFCYTDGNNKKFNTTHLVTDYIDKHGATRKKGSKSSLTLEDYKTLSETGMVVKNEKKWALPVDGQYWEIRPNLANKPMCIVDFDGLKTGGDITMAELFQMDTLPEIFAKCSFFMSRTKSLPHFIFYIDDLPKEIKRGNYISVIKGFEADILFNHAWELKDSRLFNFEAKGLSTISWNELKKIVDPSKPNASKLLPNKVIRDDISEVTHVSGFESGMSEKCKKKIAEIRLLFNAILKENTTFFDTYGKWAELGFLINNETDGCEEGCILFQELTALREVPDSVAYSHLCFQYHATQKSRDKSTQLKIASLRGWLRHLNPSHELLGGENAHFIESDFQAIEILENELKSKFIFTNNQMYFKEGNLWHNNKILIMDFLMNYILKSKIYKSNKHDDPVPYCQNVGTCKSVREGLLSSLSVATRDDSLYSRFHSSTKNKLCFIDGVLNFVEKSFTLWEDIPDDTVFTTVIITRKYADYFKNPDETIIANIERDIIGNLFGNKSKLALQFFSRAIAGNVEDKNFCSYSGNRDSGKGILYTGVESAFQAYVAPFALQNMTCERESKKSSDLAKENAWLIPLQYARLAIAQETDENENGDISKKLKINNKVMKSVMSGGDTIIGRLNYCDAIKFTIDATLAIFGNNELSITDSDSLQHHLKFSGVKQFVTQEAYDKYALMGEKFVSAYAVRDEHLKDKVRTDEYANAMVYLFYKSFVNKSITVHNPENEDGDRELSLREVLFEMFEFTNSDKDKVSKIDVFGLIKGDKKKIIAELDSLGCVGNSKDCRMMVTTTVGGNSSKKQEQAFKCLKFKEQEEE
tara:strand:+ start:522 stop:3047 length:2526 start_codon:yes stop_codon:yes gene_type:complete